MKNLTISSKPLGSLILTFFIFGIGLTMAFNLWKTESSKIPVRYTEGQFEGEAYPGDIRGSYTLGDIEEAFGIEAEVLARAFGFNPEQASGIQVKQLEEKYGELPDGGEVGTDSVRIFTALYLGRPYEGEETSRLPETALKELEGRITPDQKESLLPLVLKLTDLPQGEPETTKEDHETVNTTITEIKGNTTFGELIAAGMTQEEIETILGRPMGLPGVNIRTFMTEAGLEFSQYKDKLQERLNELNP